MIVCNVLALIAIFAQLQKIYLITATNVTSAVMSIIIFPIVGIVADTYVGRFRAIQAGIILLMHFLSPQHIANTPANYLPTIAETICVLCTMGLCCIGASCYMANAFPFAADQLIGASGEQLSFAVYWLMWGFIVASHTLLLKAFPVLTWIL